MLDPNEPVYTKPLENGLTIRSAATPDDVERVARLNDIIHGSGTGEMSSKIFLRHPSVSGRDLVFIETAQGEVAGTICLIPWTLRLGPVDLPCAELGIVGTLERFRGQGLNRLLMDYFWQRFEERGALLSIIEGIPNFYRRYGYEYAMLPLEGGWRIQPDQVPAPLEDGYSTRPATMADIPLLSRLYDEQAAALDLSARRSQDIWRFLLEKTAQPESMQHDALILEDPRGQPAGYFRVPDFHFYQNLLTIDDVSIVDFQAGLVILNHLKQMCGERGKDGIRLHLPEISPLLQMARSFGAASLGHYSWQVRIPDWAAFLRRIGPLFEQRLAGSGLFAGLTGSFSLNLYNEVIGLTFEAGQLTAVGPAGEDAQSILSVPPLQFVPLVLGGRSLEEIRTAYPDAHAREPWQLLVDTLFPKTSAFIATQY